MQHVSSLSSTTCWAVLYTKDNDANANNDDDATPIAFAELAIGQISQNLWCKVKIIQN